MSQHIQRNRSIGRRNAPLATLLLALPLALLTRCAGPADDTVNDPNTGPSHMPDAIPVVQCTSVDQCELPRSTCSASSLVYYTNARCELGYCIWDQLTSPCDIGCYSGGCMSTMSTAVSAPPVQPCGLQFGGNGEPCPGEGDVEDDGGSIACDADEDGGPGQCVH